MSAQSTTPRNGPRPLQLQRSATTGTTGTSFGSASSSPPLTSPSNGPSSSSGASPASPIPLARSPPATAGANGSQTFKRTSGHGHRHNANRRSSIAYFSPHDVDRIRSPASPSFSSRPGFGKEPASPLSRSNSMGAGVGEGARRPSHRARPKSTLGFDGVLKENISISTSTSEANVKAGPLSAVDAPPDRGPLTLAEKHADLLSFIAQKESKCMELRAQLATHEEELADLKRKWERIVHRGFDRAYGPTGLHGSGSTSTSLSTTSTPAMQSQVDNDGLGFARIREGAQGMGRLLVAGLAEMSSATAATVGSPRSTSPASSKAAGASQVVTSKTSTASKRGSTSSISTYATSSSSARLSQSSASSLTALSDHEGTEKVDKDKPAAGDDDWVWHEAPASIAETPTPKPSATTSARSSISSLPRTSGDMDSTKLQRRKSRDASSPPYSSPPSTLSTSASDSGPARNSTPLTSQPRPKAAKRTSSDMGMGILPLSPSTPLPGSGSMSSWVDSARKQLDQHNVNTNLRRASTLFSDMSQNLLSALSSPTTPLVAGLPAERARPKTTPSSSTVAARVSLLDLDDEDDADTMKGGAIMMPEPKAYAANAALRPSAGTTNATKPASPAPQDDFDDWNW